MKQKANCKVKFVGSDYSFWSEDLKLNKIYDVFIQSYDKKNQEKGNDIYIIDEVGDAVSLDKGRRIEFEFLEVNNGIIN